jgi:hypothetical protein
MLPINQVQYQTISNHHLLLPPLPLAPSIAIHQA